VDVHIENLQATVRAVDDRTLLSPDVMDTVIAELMTRWERRTSSRAQATDEARIWPSVRARDTA